MGLYVWKEKMLSQINEIPPETDAGLSFDYSVWSAGSVLRLVNVPFDNTYRDIIDWGRYGSPKSYVESFERSQTVLMDGMTYLAQGRPVRVPTPFSRAVQFNYAMATNPGRPSSAFDVSYVPTRFFYFITDVQYVNPGTTLLTLQLDVWTTYYDRVKFGRAYLERGHMGIAAKNSFEEYGRKWLNQPEGIDLGGQHLVTRAYRKVLGDVSKKNYDVLVTSTIKLDAPYGDKQNPSVSMATGSSLEGLPNAVDIWATTADGFFAGMEYLSSYPWISQGIGSVYLVPKGLFGDESVRTVSLGSAIWRTPKAINNRKTFYMTHENFREVCMRLLSPDFSELKKFMTSPYSILEFTTYTGNPLEVAPEAIDSEKIGATMWAHIAPPNPQILFSVNWHNHLVGADVIDVDQSTWTNITGEEFDATTGYQSLPTFAVLNNSALNNLASNAHTIAQQYNGARWQQRRAQRAATASRDIANAGIAATQAGAENSMWGNSANADSQSRYNNMRATVSAVQGGMTALGGVIGLNTQAIGSGLAQAATSQVNAMIQNSQAQSQAHIQNQMVSGQSQISQQQQRTVRDTNYELAQFSANGDYENAVAAINAQVQDTQVIPPSVIGQTQGTVTPMAAYGIHLDCRVRQLSRNAMTRIGEYWMRYGYAMNTWVRISHLSLMKYFTYWKLTECYLEKADMPETFKGTVRGIFEKGVTVWRDPSYIGTANVRKNQIDKSVEVWLGEQAG